MQLMTLWKKLTCFIGDRHKRKQWMPTMMMDNDAVDVDNDDAADDDAMSMFFVY